MFERNATGLSVLSYLVSESTQPFDSSPVTS